MDQKEGGWIPFPGRAGGEDHKRRLPSRQGREEKGAVIYLDQFPEALEIQTDSENHWRYLALSFANKTKKSSLTISHSFPAEPPLFAIRSIYPLIWDLICRNLDILSILLLGTWLDSAGTRKTIECKQWIARPHIKRFVWNPSLPPRGYYEKGKLF